jgi:hypothetical protein
VDFASGTLLIAAIRVWTIGSVSMVGCIWLCSHKKAAGFPAANVGRAREYQASGALISM